MPMEPVPDATVDSPLIMESAKSLPLNQSLMLDATPGKLESAQLAQKIGYSIPTMSAEQFPTNVRLTTSAMDGVLHATKDMTSLKSLMPTTMSSMLLATSLLLTLLLLLILVAKLGKMELVLPAQPTGTLMPMESANLSLISVKSHDSANNGQCLTCYAGYDLS